MQSVKEAYIVIKGDTSVGIPDVVLTAEVYFEIDLEDSEDRRFLGEFRTKLMDAYDLLGDPCYVEFDFERYSGE